MQLFPVGLSNQMLLGLVALLCGAVFLFSPDGSPAATTAGDSNMKPAVPTAVSLTTSAKMIRNDSKMDLEDECGEKAKNASSEKLDGGEKNVVSVVATGAVDQLEAALKKFGPEAISDEQVVSLVSAGKIAPYALEKTLRDSTRAVVIRRMLIGLSPCPGLIDIYKGNAANVDLLDCGIPYNHFDYDKVTGVCCENVVGYLPIPVGIAGPILVNGVSYHIPMATTEGIIALISFYC